MASPGSSASYHSLVGHLHVVVRRLQVAKHDEDVDEDEKPVHGHLAQHDGAVLDHHAVAGVRDGGGVLVGLK